MKAEQRKELETNTLADRMGKVVQRVKTSPRRTFFTYLFIIAVLAGAAWYGWRLWSEARVTESAKWVQLYDGAGNHIEFLLRDKESNPGKAARFQAAWLLYWDFGVKMLATNSEGSLQSLKEAGEMYKKLAEECKDDKVFEPQALLGRAVVEETFAVQDRKRLDKAKVFYEEIVEKHAKSAEGKYAQERLERLKANKGRDLINTYETLQRLLGVPEDAPAIPPGFLPGGHPPIFPPDGLDPKGKKGGN
jgi:hypothetical protein